MYLDFPKLNPDVVNEDKVTAFRCAFFGGAIYIDEPLVRYRAGVGVSTLHGDILRNREDPTREASYVRTGLTRRLAVLKQMQVDVRGDALGGRDTLQLRSRIDRAAASMARVLYFIDAPALRGLPALFAAGGLSRQTAKIAILFLAPGVYRRYKLYRHRNTLGKEQQS